MSNDIAGDLAVSGTRFGIFEQRSASCPRWLETFCDPSSIGSGAVRDARDGYAIPNKSSEGSLILKDGFPEAIKWSAGTGLLVTGTEDARFSSGKGHLAPATPTSSAILLVIAIEARFPELAHSRPEKDCRNTI